MEQVLQLFTNLCQKIKMKIWEIQHKHLSGGRGPSLGDEGSGGQPGTSVCGVGGVVGGGSYLYQLISAYQQLR